MDGGLETFGMDGYPSSRSCSSGVGFRDRRNQTGFVEQNSASMRYIYTQQANSLTKQGKTCATKGQRVNIYWSSGSPKLAFGWDGVR